MSEDIRKMIDKVKNFKQFVNENHKPIGDYIIALKGKYEKEKIEIGRSLENGSQVFN
jgi:hypothetical protein